MILASKPPSSLFDELRARGFDPDKLHAENCLRIVDWYSQRQESIVELEEIGPVIKVSLDLLNVGIGITRAITSLNKDKPRRAVIEILSPASSMFDLAQVHTFAQATKAKLSRHNITSLFLIEKGMHDQTALSTLIQPFDGVIDLDRVREGDKIVRKLAVLSLKGTATSSQYVPFEVTKNGFEIIEDTAPPPPAEKPEEPSEGKPRDANLWLSLGRTLYQTKRYEKSLVAIESCLRIDPKNTEALELKIKTLETTGRADEADRIRLSVQGDVTEKPQVQKVIPTVSSKSEKITRILESSEARLQEHPKDADALFAKATALAALNRNDESLEVLNKVTKINHRYPGLWLLKAKLYAMSGDASRANLCRMRAKEIEEEIEAAEIGAPRRVQFICPVCDSQIDKDTDRCPSCAAIFTEPIQKAPEVQEAPATEVQKKRVAKRKRTERSQTVPSPLESASLTDRRIKDEKKGRTNGLTNGLRGRTNGLTNGLRGRTNGLTNGLRGRTNGLTNGIKTTEGKVNGLAYEGMVEGVTNGLVNGLLSLKIGITNGLTNGNGFTNGLGTGKFRNQAVAYRWRLYTVPLVAGILLIFPLLFPTNLQVISPYKISIDGDFNDWSNQRILSMSPDLGVSPNVQIVNVGITENHDYVSFFLEVQGNMLEGGPVPQRLMDAARIFMDVDQKKSTGYLVRGLGADWMAEVWGWDGVVYSARLWRYLPSASFSQDEWSGWERLVSIRAEASQGRLETEVPVKVFNIVDAKSISVLFQMKSWDGQEQFSQYIVSIKPEILRVNERSLATRVLTGNNVSLLGIELTSSEGVFDIAEIHVRITGTAALSSISRISLLDGSGSTLDTRIPSSKDIAFRPLLPIHVDNQGSATLTVVADIAISDGSTLGLALADEEAVVGADTDDPHFTYTRFILSSQYPKGYLGFVPVGVVIDGAFDEWTGAEIDQQGELSTNNIDSLDIAQFDADLNSSASFFLKMYGTVLQGTATPQPSLAAPGTVTPPVADSDMDTVPDVDDFYPFDFNNDGVPDNQTVNDIDSDGILDYPTGTDTWLNTTIPASFPSPYANRPVNLYIGPSFRPLVQGEDFAHFFVDVDNSTGTGYSVYGIGADYMVEIRGREGRITNKSMWQYTGSGGPNWRWSVMSEPSAALEQSSLEASGQIPGLNSASRVVWEMSDWRDSAGDFAESATRGSRGLSLGDLPEGSVTGLEVYKDESGNAQFADLNLIPTDGMYAYSVEKNSVASYFRGLNDGSGLMLLQRNDLYFSWQPRFLGVVQNNSLSWILESNATSIEAAGCQAVYPQLFPGVDDRYTVMLNQVKHDLVFHAAPQVPQIGERLAVTGDMVVSEGSVLAIEGEVQTDGFVSSSDIQIISPQGVVLTLQAPYAYEDGNNDARAVGIFRVQKASGGWELSMEVPLQWFFNPGRSYPVILDPTAIIDTSTSTSPTIYHHQRKIFYDGTYFWAFFFDGSNTMYEYSSDGMSWVNAKAQAFTTSGVQYASVWYHDTGSSKIVYITGDVTVPSKTVIVRRGTISGTTITWGSEYKPTISSNNDQSRVPTIIRGSSGYIWVSARSKDGALTYNYGVIRSTNVDDISAWGAQTTLLPSSLSSSYIDGTIVPLSGGDVYAAWYANGNIDGKKFTSGSGWGSVETIDTAPASILYATPSATVDGSNIIHMVFVNSSGNVIYRQRTTSWSSPTTLNSSSGNQGATMTRETSSGDLYAFWKSSGNQIYGKTYSSSTWSSVTLETNTISKNWVTSIYNASSSSNICWAWSEGAGSVKDVRFSKLSTTVTSRTIDTTTSSTPNMYSHQRKIIFDGSYFWAFYDDGTNSYYTYSDTGSTWTYGYTQLFTTANTVNPSVWYYSSGSTKIVYVVGDDNGNDNTVVVKRGTISGTTITWGSDYTATVSTQSLSNKIPFICRDTTGYLWIGSNQADVTYNFTATRSTNTDDVSAWDSPTAVMKSISASNYVYGIVLPLGSGDVYALWYGNGYINGSKYTSGSGWGSVEAINTTSSGAFTKGPSAVVDASNNVHMVFSNSTGRIIYRNRTTSWGTATVVGTTSNNVYPTITLVNSSQILYIFWINSSYQIIGKKNSSTTWSSISGIDIGTRTKVYLTSIYSISSSTKVAWMWGQGSSSPYETKFARIPEFENIALCIVGTIFILIFQSRLRKSRRKGIHDGDVPRQ